MKNVDGFAILQKSIAHTPYTNLFNNIYLSFDFGMEAVKKNINLKTVYNVVFIFFAKCTIVCLFKKHQSFKIHLDILHYG